MRAVSQGLAFSRQETVLVVGGTGTQGGAVVRCLLAAGRFQVRVLTRLIHSPKAQNLERLGAEIVPGQLQDRASRRAALGGCRGVFSASTYYDRVTGERLGTRNLMYAVAASEMDCFAYSVCAESGPGRGHPYSPEARDLNCARELELPVVVLRPAPAVATEHLRRLAVQIFQAPEDFLGQTLHLKGSGHGSQIENLILACLPRGAGKSPEDPGGQFSLRAETWISRTCREKWREGKGKIQSGGQRHVYCAGAGLDRSLEPAPGEDSSGCSVQRKRP